MSAQREERLAPLLEVARAQARELAQQAGDFARVQASEEASLARLKDYLDEYARQSPSQVRHAAQLGNHRRFLDRLSAGVRQQREQVAQAAQRSEAAAERWRAARGEVEAMERLLERMSRARLRDGERREQREMDELAARRGPEPEVPR